MNIEEKILKQTQLLFENLSCIYSMMAKHPGKIQVILPQIDLNLKCIKELLHTYPLAFSSHAEDIFLQLSKGQESILKNPSFSLLSTISRQSFSAVQELVPENPEKIETMKNLHFDVQINNLLSNINTFIGFIYLVYKIENQDELKTLKDLVFKNFKTIDHLMTLCLAYPHIQKQFTLDVKEQIQKVHHQVTKTLNAKQLNTKSLLLLTQHIMTAIESIKLQQLSA